MLQTFQQDFWSLARENKGYYAWARKERWHLYRALHGRRKRCCPMCDEDADPVDMVQSLFEDGLRLHPLLDIAFDAFARAEARLGLRFVPQRSHEERLTGHLISELEAAIQMASKAFAEAASDRYSEKLSIDFVYSDLSRGGKMEKLTGGDFGLILVIDLPDRPKLVRYVAIQAKRLQGSTSLDKEQFDTITTNFGDAAAYLFYDCAFDTLAPPLIMPHSKLAYLRKEKDDTQSFSVTPDFVFGNAIPLSLWLLTELGAGRTGTSASDFKSAYSRFTRFVNHKDGLPFSRLAMVSIGRPFEVTPNIESGLEISL